jgi:hypothetical protein
VGWGVIAKESGVYFWDNKNALKLSMVLMHNSECTKATALYTLNG